MSLLMRRRMLDTQRKNGLTDFTESNQGYCMRPVESEQLNYKAQNCQATTSNMNMPMPSNDNNYYVASVPMPNGQQQQQPMKLERIQLIKRSQGDQPNVTPVENATAVINSNWSHSEGVPAEDARAESPETSAAIVADEENNGLAETGAYYDPPVYIDPITYQQQQQQQQPQTQQQQSFNSINAAVNAASNLARCSNVNCMHCKRTSSSS